MEIGADTAAVGALTSLVTLVTTWLGMRVTAATRRKENEETLGRLALEQSKAAFASVSGDIERYRQDVDRARAECERYRQEGERTQRIVDAMTLRVRTLEHELEAERDARRRAEARVEDLSRQLLATSTSAQGITVNVSPAQPPAAAAVAVAAVVEEPKA